MRSTPLLLSASLVIAAAACGGGDDASSTPDANTVDAAVAPVFRNPVDMDDATLAMTALQMIGANVEGADRNCNACHSITKTRLRSWEVLSDAAMANCLTDLGVTDPTAALDMTNCLRVNPNDATTDFSPGVIGFYATAANLEWFTYLFELAYGADGQTMHDDFAGHSLMPRGDHPSFTQGEFDILAEWVARDLVMLDDLLTDETLPGDCTEEIAASTEIQAHVTSMETTGWAAVNAAVPLNMYGCAGASGVRDCMNDQPLSSTTGFGADWADDLPGSQLRVLKTINYTSAYWTRSSPDGRFLAHGGNDDSMDGSVNYESTMIDLTDDHLIYMSTYYDPGFFPDNSGFMFQGNSTRICPLSVLTGSPAPVTFSYTNNSPPCVQSNSIGLYQHLGAALGGGDYWTVAGPFESDSGGHQATLGDPDAPFTSTASHEFTALEFTGGSYVVGDQSTIATPNEGDMEMSPSTGLLISRVAGTGGQQNGFRIRQFLPVADGSGGYNVTIPEVGRLCMNGGKPGFSYDERWLVLHHYVTDDDATDLGFSGPADPGFAAYKTQGAANIYLVDLTTGDRIRITHMSPGQYALFPHFRSDGWIYFNVRIAGQATEHFVASDAALLASGL